MAEARQARGAVRGSTAMSTVMAAVRLDLRLVPTWYLPLVGVVYLLWVCAGWLARLLGEGTFSSDQSPVTNPVVWCAVLVVAVPSVQVWTASADRMRLLHGMLPLSRRDILRARYTQLLVSLVVLLVVIVGAQSASVGLGVQGWGGALGVWVLVALALVAVPPLVLMYGTGETGQWVLRGFMVVWLGFWAGVAGVVEESGQPLVASPEGLVGLAALVTVLGAVGLYGSWCLSLRLSSRQDL
ncbi:ABC-2 transporter permease [Actinomyces wuliandei]|uniref:ABC-2 transporter permease n=1 Tax=Actinomyces wuliandei TaxID=2057743 RepID=UPI000FD733D5|nr:ABC-2 transporter permease [Actinomyces wuliandei]